jgi:hypothetical protein
VSAKVFSDPRSSRRLPLGTATTTENGALVCFWQCRQWQSAVSTGSASQA